MKIQRLFATDVKGNQHTFNYKGMSSKRAVMTIGYGATPKTVKRLLGCRRANVLFKMFGMNQHSTISSNKVGI